MISLTQYLMPDGRPRPVTIERPPEVKALAGEVEAAGGTFECELLSAMEVLKKHHAT